LLYVKSFEQTNHHLHLDNRVFLFLAGIDGTNRPPDSPVFFPMGHKNMRILHRIGMKTAAEKAIYA